MLVSDVKTRVSRAIGDDDLLFVTSADFLRFINDAQTDIVRKTECLQGTTSIATTVGTSSYTLTSTILSLKRVTLEGQVLTPLSPDQVDGFTGRVNPSGSTNSYLSGSYFVWGNKIYVDPSDCGGNLEIMYVKLPATLTADGDSLEIPIQMGEDVVNYVMARAYERLDDTRASQQWVAYEAKIAIARDESHRRQSTYYPSVQLTDADWDY